MLERFLRYVVVDTQSDPTSTTYPSTEKQLDLSRLLVEELRQIGLDDVELTEPGYVFATVPGTVEGAPTVGLIAHVDTSPAAPGAGVEPIVHRAWAGEPIVLPGDAAQVLDPEDMPGLAEKRGHDIVTSDGTTLLGADDKAGVAIIVTAARRLLAEDAPRATARIAFTVDEEVGRGTDHFDLEAFGADFAYTFDGSGLGEVETETFSAYQLVLTITGVGVHPGTAKGRLVNALKLLADVIAALPRERLSPETTEDREGFVHPERLDGHRVARDPLAHRPRPRRREARGARRARARDRGGGRRARAARLLRPRRRGAVPEHAHGARPAPARSSRRPRRRSAGPASSPCTASSVAAPTARG